MVVINRARKDSCENARVSLLLVWQSRFTVRCSQCVLQSGTVTRYASMHTNSK